MDLKMTDPNKFDPKDLPALDCIAAKLNDKIMAAAELETWSEEIMFEILNSESAQIVGKRKRNEASFILFFTDNSVLRIDFEEQDDESSSIATWIGQYHPNPNAKAWKEIETNVPFITPSKSIN